VVSKAKQPHGPPMTLGNMRHLGVQRLVATCLKDACRHQGLIDVSKYPADTEMPWFANKVVCAKCGARGRHIDVRPNWKEQPMQFETNQQQWR
jgi:hypothetical protein